MTRPASPLPSRRGFAWSTAGLLAAALALPLPAAAQAWPDKPIKVVVNFPPGGAADQLARLIGQPLSEALHQPVVIENRGGANGNIGGETVARSAPDGYTLLMSSGGMVSVNPHLYQKMPFDPAKDLVPVAAAARVLVFLVERPELPPKNIQEFIAYLKARPGKLSYGSPGVGSSPHLAGEMFKSQTGTFATHVPYRGAAPALQDLLAGQIDFYFDPGIALQQGGTAPDSKSAFSAVLPYYVIFREADAASSTPWQPGSTLNWVQALFSDPTGPEPYLASAPAQTLLTAAGLTPKYDDLGNVTSG